MGQTCGSATAWPRAIRSFDALLQLSVSGSVAKSKIDRELYKRQGQPPFLKATAQQAREPA